MKGRTCHRNSRSVPSIVLDHWLCKVPLYPGLLVRPLVMQGGLGLGTEGLAFLLPLCSREDALGVQVFCEAGLLGPNKRNTC